MDAVIDLCKGAIQYPQNSKKCAWSSDLLEHQLYDYQSQIIQHRRRLFTSEAESALNFHDLDNEGKGTFMRLRKSDHLHTIAEC